MTIQDGVHPGAPGADNHCRTFKLVDAILFSESHQPWEVLNEDYTTDPPVPSMMCSHELKFLHYLARTQSDGTGAIVDLGPLVGSSTYALASGIACGNRAGTIYSYDLWRFCPTFEPFVANAKLRVGDDILPYFQANIERFRDRIVAQKGDLGRKRWNDGPIRILFVDAAKSPRLMHHIANEFFPHLLPGALVVHQDWVSAEDPWIHIAMGELAEYFDVMDSPEGGTLCFRVKKQVPRHALPANFMKDSNAPQLLAAARSALHSWHGLCVWLAEARYYVLVGDIPKARYIVTEVQRHSLFNPKQIGFDLALVERAIANRELQWYSRLRRKIAELIGSAGWR